MTGETVLVTGASGFIGSHLVAALAADGATVHALGRRSARFEAFVGDHPVVHCHTIPDDLRLFRALLADIKPEACYHLATYFVAEHQPEDIEPLVASNVLFPTMLADALAELGDVAFVNVGTAWQHRNGHPYSPNDLYAATKQAFDDILTYYAESGHLRVVHLRLFDTYGPHDPRRKLLRLLLDTRRRGTRLEMSPGHQLIDLLHVSDAVEALRHARRAAGRGAPVGFAASSGEAVTLRGLVEIVEQATGGPLDVEWGASPYRGLEMFEPWTVAPPPPAWRPRIALAHGIRQVWLDERCDD